MKNFFRSLYNQCSWVESGHTRVFLVAAEGAVRVNHRNGYMARAWETRSGMVDLKIPEQHLGSYFPEFLEPRRAADDAMTAVNQKLWLKLGDAA